MRVNIKGTEYEYKSDYPAGWIRRNRDFFQFPVKIGNHSCFIKRFENQNPSSISGWELLVTLEKNHAPNLVRIYDIKSVEEKGKRVFYVFYEALTGDTLDTAISKHTPFNLAALAKDMFQAIASLQKRNFWFADFLEANIFLEESGRFVLIDLDSAQPVSKDPAENMQGSKNYWGPVFDFYTKILKYENLKVADLTGISLNNLQVIFLILRLRLLSFYQQGIAADPDASNNLHIQLEEIAPDFNELFIRVYNERKSPRYRENADEIEKLINQKVITHNPGYPKTGGIDIKSFTATPPTIAKKEIFELSWEVHGATYIDLHKNGRFDERFTEGKKTVTKTSFYDGGVNTITYKLIAYNDNHELESDPVVIRISMQTAEPSDLKIINFAASRDVVESGENFELNWEVNGATHLDLYKNDEFDERFTEEEKTVTRTSFYDDLSNLIAYKLIAYNDNRSAESDRVFIKIRMHVSDTANLEIINFAANTDAVENGDSFELNWEINDADYIELYKDGELNDKFTDGEISVTKYIYSNGGKTSVSYWLIAYKNNEKIESDVLYIRIKTPVSESAKTIVENYPGREVHRSDERLELAEEDKNTAYIKQPAIEFAVENYSEKNEDDYVVESGKPFNLTWNVQGAMEIQIQKDGRHFKTVNNTVKSTAVTEDLNGEKEKEINYSLSALFKGTSNIEVKFLKIIVKPSRPAIKQFKASKYNLKNGGSFNLSWDVQNATDISVYRNNILYKTLGGNEKSIEANEKYEGVQRNVKYSIHATNGLEKIESLPLDIFVKPPFPIKIVLAAVAGLILLVATYYILSNPGHGNDIVFYPLQYDKVSTGDTITIFGKNFPENDGSLTVKFNDKSGKVVKSKNDSIQVEVPPLGKNTKTVTIVANVKSKTYPVAQNLFYERKIIISSGAPKLFPFVNSLITQDEIITISGQNLLTIKGAMQIKFNGVDAMVIQQTRDSISVLVPALRDKRVDITARMNGENIVLVQGILYRRTNVEPLVPTIFAFKEPDVNEEQVISIRGVNLPTGRGTAVVLFNNEPGTIIRQDTKELRVIVPTLPGAISGVNISVTINARVLKVFNNVRYKYKRIGPPVNPPKLSLSVERLIEKHYIEIFGVNFPTKPGSIIVKFNNIPAYINQQNPTALRVQVPTVPDGVNRVNISVIIGGQTIKVFNNLSYQPKPQDE